VTVHMEQISTPFSSGSHVDIRELHEGDLSFAIELWRAVDLVREWNDPVGDFRSALAGATSTILGAEVDGVLVGTAMVGFDGHRGWLYYVAVNPSLQRRGVGSALTRAGEEWLASRGAHKVQLMVRRGNDDPRLFYSELGYAPSDVTVFAKWLTPDAT
jgi:ribosomal protein S18 acetylase RimI-like enzyme